jgi:hypothetical protein
VSVVVARRLAREVEVVKVVVKETEAGGKETPFGVVG